jgi:hypothetical protein
MILLTATTDKVQLVSSAAATLDVHVSFMDMTTADPPVVKGSTSGKQNTAITTATTTDILAAPASSTVRNMKTLNVRNKHASLACDCTVLFNQNGTSYELAKQTVRAGETMEYIEGVGFFIVQGPPAPAPTYSTADQAITTADTYITGSQILLPTGRALVAGTQLVWQFVITKSAGTGTPVWNLRFGTGVIGDTARITLTHLVAQTGVADTAFVTIQALVRSVGASGVVTAGLNLDHQLAATGFATTANITIAGTSAAFDTTTVTGIGVSVTPGTASAWTVTLATAEIKSLIA